MNKVTLKVKRFDPEKNQTRQQEYNLEVASDATVLDGLVEAREYQDPTLGVRCSCRSSICGSCGMRINGRARLACKTKIVDVASDSQPITIEPLGNMPPIKDLVADMSGFWAKVRQVEPYIKPHEPPPEREYIAPQKAMEELAGVMNCVMCGCCVSDCTSLAVDANFIGPAALAKSYRFVADPRETEEARDERLRELVKYGGIWDCTHCYECVQVCPKDVAPLERILDLRRTSQEAGYRDNNGTRHSNSIAKSVKHSGSLNELTLVPESLGFDDIQAQMKFVPSAVRGLVKGKLPPFIHHKRPGAENVKRIFEELEKE